MSPKLADRLSKLLPLLASDKEGEVLATVRAIRAALLGEGLDLHDLSASIANGDVVTTPRAPQIAAAPTWDHLTYQEQHAWMRSPAERSRPWQTRTGVPRRTRSDPQNGLLLQDPLAPSCSRSPPSMTRP